MNSAASIVLNGDQVFGYLERIWWVALRVGAMLMLAPMIGTKMISTVQPALPQPDRSRLRKTSIRIQMSIQIHRTHRKKYTTVRKALARG